MKKPLSITASAILWFNLSAISSAFMVSLVRVVSEDMHVSEIIFFRNIFAFLLFIPIIWVKGFDKFKTDQMGLHVLRSITGVIAMLAFFYSISVMNLSVVTSLSFAAPLFTSVFAFFIFKDRPGIKRISALIIGFIGALIIIRPGFEGYDQNSLIVLFSAVFWALSGILIKKLGETDHPLAITFYMTVWMMVFTAPLAFYFWKTPTYEELIYIFFIAVTSNILQYALAKAFSMADFSVLLPFDYTRLIYTSIIAYFAFGEVLDIPAAIGSAIILGSAAYTAYRETKLSKKQAAVDR